MKVKVWDKARNRWLEETESSLHCYSNHHLNFDGSVCGLVGAIDGDHERSVQYEDLTWVDYHPGKITSHSPKERFKVLLWSGLKAFNQEIYEDDVLNSKASRRLVEFKNGAFYARKVYGLGEDYILLSEFVEIGSGGPSVPHLGNANENPDLIGEFDFKQ